jgi:formate dehydrogenase maturation protein FdhE
MECPNCREIPDQLCMTEDEENYLEEFYCSHCRSFIRLSYSKKHDTENHKFDELPF